MLHASARALIASLFLLSACSKGASSQSSSPPSAPASTAAESDDIDKNETPLPTYPHLVKANMLSVPNPNTGCVEYMSSTNDQLSDAVAWYRSKLGGAKETPFKGDYQGVDFTVNGTDHVMVFTLGNTGTSITMMHATTGKSCGRGDGRPG
ncbi:MAG TPA: hypothetical protein VK511_06360 [Gemmatimonadaceae bacterium]|nr:hypothetical protein [Gemmatimonadaceae bacterium]